jgi:hypothetical protein
LRVERDFPVPGKGPSRKKNIGKSKARLEGAGLCLHGATRDRKAMRQRRRKEALFTLVHNRTPVIATASPSSHEDLWTHVERQTHKPSAERRLGGAFMTRDALPVSFPVTLGLFET